MAIKILFWSVFLLNFIIQRAAVGQQLLSRVHEIIIIKLISLFPEPKADVLLVVCSECAFCGESCKGFCVSHTVLKCLCSPSTAQRSAQELPLVEKQSIDSYSATGGKMMLLSGLNFLHDSKVVFVEKAQGRLQSCLLPLNFQCVSPLLPATHFLILSSRQNRAGLASKPHVVCIKPLYF